MELSGDEASIDAGFSKTPPFLQGVSSGEDSSSGRGGRFVSQGMPLKRER